MKKHGNRPVWAALLCVLLCVCVCALADVEQDSEGGTWDWDRGVYTAPDGSTHQIDQLNDEGSSSGGSSSGGSSQESSSGGAMVIDTGEEDPMAGIEKNEGRSCSTGPMPATAPIRLRIIRIL